MAIGVDKAEHIFQPQDLGLKTEVKIRSCYVPSKILSCVAASIPS